MDTFDDDDLTDSIKEALNDDEDFGNQVVIGVVHFVIGIFAFQLIRSFCCRSKPATPVYSNDVVTADVEHLQPKKRLRTGYQLLFSCGLVGGHHFYLGRVIHGLLACWSLNFFCVGWVLDFFLMPFYIYGFNRRRTAELAQYDNSTRQLLVKLPLTYLFVVFVTAGIFVNGPWALSRVGVVDIDMVAAQTAVNPYDTLGISRSAGLAEAKSAYRKQSLKWHPDRNPNCGQECTDKMSEITKAFDLIKKRQAPQSRDVTWKTWLEDLGRDWWSVFEAFTKDKEADKPKSGNATHFASGKPKPKKKTDL